MTDTFPLTLLGIGASAVHFLGLLHAGFAIMKSRTSQGATAWAISLITFPYLALPLFWVFGRNKFEGYILARRSGDQQLVHMPKELEGRFAKYRVTFERERSATHALESLAKMHFVSGNRAKLLIDGEQTFDAILEGLRSATNYILIQFFIFKNDRIGMQVIDILKQKAKSGVRVFLLLDEVGSHRLPNEVITDMRIAGVKMSWFGAGRRNRFQFNFRNHRKIVVIDGKTSYLGGLNVGDEYLGRSKVPKLAPWRDTHMEIAGPAVLGTQLSFVEDWYWATNSVPRLDWTPRKSENNSPMLILPTGPADELETCELMFILALNQAKERVWIATPYFVPSEALVSALQLAALRGVDVRILLPEHPDHYFVYLASFSYLRQTEPYGIKIFKYQEGFMHQKVLLVDNDVGAVGSANFDNRSFGLNFEITAFVVEQAFAQKVHDMLCKDFAKCRRFHAAEVDQHSLGFRLMTKVARLLAPVL